MAFKKPLTDLDNFINGGEVELKPSSNHVEPVSENIVSELIEPSSTLNDIAVQLQDIQPIENGVIAVKKSNRGRKPKSSQTEYSEGDERDLSGKNKTIFSQNDEDFDAFRNYAFIKRMTKTSIIRMALKEYMKNHPC